MKFATREQLQRKHNLGTDRNALKVLGEMKDYLHSRTLDGKNVYWLSSVGRELIGAESEVKWSIQVEHHLLRGDMYLYYNCPADWFVEEPVTVTQGLSQFVVIPDATFTLDGVFHFLEVDRTQSMSDNKKKIEQYAKLNPLIHTQFNHQPILVFYTTTPLRKEKLTSLCDSLQVKCKIYTKEDIH